MKRLRFAAVLAAAVVTSVTLLCACAENLQDTGNKIVSNAKDYLQSEAGFDGDVSKLRDNAADYLNEELGLNNSANKTLQGTWNTDRGDARVTWTFNGENLCLLTDKDSQTDAEGTYSVDEAQKTVTIAVSSWSKPVTFTYKLRQTLSDEYLDLTSDAHNYYLIKQK